MSLTHNRGKAEVKTCNKCTAKVSATLAGFNPQLKPICPYCGADL